MLVIDEMTPTVAPDRVVPVPVPRLVDARGKQGCRRQTFCLHPEVFVVVTDFAVRAKAIKNAAMPAVPCFRQSGVEQLHGARCKPVGRTGHGRRVPLHDEQQLGPFGKVTGLITPGTKNIRFVAQVVVPIDSPIGLVVFPDHAAGQRSLTHRNVVRHRFRAVQVSPLAAGLEGCQQGFAGMHVGVLPAVGIEDSPIGAGLVGVQAVLGLPEMPLHQGEGLFHVLASLAHAGH